MKRLLLLLITILLCSCGPSRYTRMVRENDRLSKEVSDLREITQAQAESYRSAQKPRGYYSQGGLVKNINGVIIAKAINRTAGMAWFFYIKLDNNKQIRWETSQSKYSAKQVGSPVYFEYIGKYRFKDNLIK